MKRDRHGRAKTLTLDEIELLFSQSFQTERDRAVFGFALYTACWINEACTQLTVDVYDQKGKVRPQIEPSRAGKLAKNGNELIN